MKMRVHVNTATEANMMEEVARLHNASIFYTMFTGVVCIIATHFAHKALDKRVEELEKARKDEDIFSEAEAREAIRDISDAIINIEEKITNTNKE